MLASAMIAEIWIMEICFALMINQISTRHLTKFVCSLWPLILLPPCCWTNGASERRKANLRLAKRNSAPQTVTIYQRGGEQHGGILPTRSGAAVDRGRDRRIAHGAGPDLGIARHRGRVLGGQLLARQWRADHGDHNLVDAFHRHDGGPVSGPD